MEEREIHLREYLRVISKRRYTVLTFFVIFFAIVLIWTLSSVPVYMSTAKLLIEKGQPQGQAILNMYYQQVYDPEFYETQYELIKSESVAQKVLDILSLNQDEEASGKGPPPLTAKAISGNIRVQPIRESRIVNVSYMSTNPEIATQIVNSLARAYIEKLLEMRLSSSRYSIGWMTEKAKEEKTKLEKAENTLQSYMRANDIVTLQDRISVMPQKLSEVSRQLVKTEAKRKEMESLNEKLVQASGQPDYTDTIQSIANEPAIESLRRHILEAEQKIMELSKKFREKHPVMISAIADLEGLRSEKTREIKRTIDSIKNDYELLKSNEENLRKLLSDTKREAIDLNEKFIQYEALQRELDTNKQLYDAIMKKITEQDLTKQIQSVEVWVVEKAELPTHPVKPNKPLNIMLGLMVGLLGGVGIAFFLEYLDNTIKSPDEAEEKLGVPVLGVISNIKEVDSIEDLVLKEPASVFAEQHRTLRTAITLSSPGKSPKNILISSTGPEEGKTVTSVNLALSMAQSEYEVLLVDSDLRRPRIHKIFGLDNSKGLSTFLSGASDDDILLNGPVNNMKIIPAGPIPPNPSELLSSSVIKDFIGILNEKFDIIIWDSPPLLTVSDSIILSNILDGTILVVWAGRTTYEGALRSLKSMHDIKSHVLGIVINAFDAKKGDYYYHKYYKYYSSDDRSEV